MKKTALFMLLALTVLSVFLFASCNSAGSGNNDVNPGNNTEASDTADTTAPAEEKEPTKEELVEKAIADLQKDYNKDEIRFFVRNINIDPNWGSREIFAEEETNEPINDAVYKRNLFIEEKFNVTIAQTEATSNNMTAAARTLLLSGDDTNDVYMLPINTAATLSQEGLFYDLNNVANIDLTSPWWDQAVKDGFAFGNKMYFIIGDISILDKVATRGIYFNKDMVKSYNLENPYELVEKNEWTLEKMYELSKKVYSDADSNGVLNNLDTYGLVFEQHSLPQMYLSMGGTTVELDDGGNFEITFMNDKNQALLTKIMEYLYDRDVCYGKNTLVHPRTESTISARVMFEEGHALFFECGFNNLELMRATETDFGIVPFPKYDPANKFYSSYYLGGPACVCLPITNANVDSTAAVVEALCAQSSITLMPAYYETCIQGKYTRDEEAVEMLDIIFDNRMYDVGCIFTDTQIYNNMMSLANAGNSNVASMWARIEGNFTNIIEQIALNYK